MLIDTIEKIFNHKKKIKNIKQQSKDHLKKKQWIILNQMVGLKRKINFAKDLKRRNHMKSKDQT